MIRKRVFVFRDNKTVIGRDNNGYQIYSASPSNIHLGQALAGYYLSRLNIFWYPPSPCAITVWKLISKADELVTIPTDMSKREKKKQRKTERKKSDPTLVL